MAEEGDKPNPNAPDLFHKAQYLIQLLVGSDLSPEDYSENLELVREKLEEIYWIGYAKASSRDVFNRTTAPPPTPNKTLQSEIDLAAGPDDE